MANMIEILKESAAYVERSGFTVTIDRRFPTVTIEDADGEGFHFSEHEADAFIAGVEKLIDEVNGDIDFDTAAMAEASTYIDCL